MEESGPRLNGAKYDHISPFVFNGLGVTKTMPNCCAP